MKHAGFKLQTERGGWLRTTLCPVKDKHESRFGFADVLMFTALVCTTIAIARVLIAH
jgi:hypothetical protein